MVPHPGCYKDYAEEPHGCILASDLPVHSLSFLSALLCNQCFRLPVGGKHTGPRVLAEDRTDCPTLTNTDWFIFEREQANQEALQDSGRECRSRLPTPWEEKAFLSELQPKTRANQKQHRTPAPEGNLPHRLQEPAWGPRGAFSIFFSLKIVWVVVLGTVAQS